MRRVLAATLIVATFLVALAPQGQAAINHPRGFHEDFPYMAGLNNGAMTVVSGKAEATTTNAIGSYGFFDSGGATISGLTKVCYGTTCPAGNGPFNLVVSNGGSFAVCFPAASGGEFTADHALALFVDFAQDDDLNSFGVDKSLVAPSVDALFHFTSIPAVATRATPTAPCSQDGGLTALDDTTTIQVRGAQQTLATLTGKNARVSFTGAAQVTDVIAGFYIVPFNGGGTADFHPAGFKDAKEGLDLGRVQELIRMLDSAHSGNNVDRGQGESGGNNTQAILAGLLNGALLRLPDSPQDGEKISFDGSRFVRFSHLTVQGGNGLAWDGKAYLDVEDGKVAGAKPLVGFWLFKLPWWSYLLWAAAITLASIRLVTKPDKNNPRWDRLRWIGWVATPLAWVIVFFLWDLEVHAVLGASLLRDSSGQFRLIVGALQVALLLIVGVAAAAPLKVIGRNTSMLAHQGTFMGVSGSIAAILGYLFTAPYLRAFFGVLLKQVLDKLG